MNYFLFPYILSLASVLSFILAVLLWNWIPFAVALILWLTLGLWLYLQTKKEERGEIT